ARALSFCLLSGSGLGSASVRTLPITYSIARETLWPTVYLAMSVSPFGIHCESSLHARTAIATRAHYECASLHQRGQAPRQSRGIDVARRRLCPLSARERSGD